MVLGRYAAAPQLGVRGYRNDNKIREEPGRIPYTLAMKHIQKIGTPDPSKIVVEEKTLKEITEMDKYGYFKIVKIKDVYFTGYDSDGKKLNDEIFPVGRKECDGRFGEVRFEPYVCSCDLR